MTKRSISSAYEVFFKSIIQGSLEGLIHDASEYFHHPILLTDENYRLLCLYPKRKINNNIYDSLFETNTLDHTVIREYQETYLKSNPTFYEPFYSNTGLTAASPRIFGEVHDTKKIYGHIAIFMEDSPLEENDLEITSILLDAIRLLMIPKLSTELSYSTYLHDLIDGKTSPSGKSLANTILSSHISPPYYIGCGYSGESAADQAYATMLLHTLPASSIHTLYGNNIISLMNESSYQEYKKYILETNLNVGISTPFIDLYELRNHYKQAYYTSRLAEDDCLSFDSIYPEVLFKSMDVDKKDAFIIPVMKQIVEYDKSHDTEYYPTLSTYVKSFANKENTASKLNIHRNTLLYRLNRISELFDLNLQDETTLASLLCSIYINSITQK